MNVRTARSCPVRDWIAREPCNATNSPTNGRVVALAKGRPLYATGRTHPVPGAQHSASDAVTTGAQQDRAAPRGIDAQAAPDGASERATAKNRMSKPARRMALFYARFASLLRTMRK